MVDMFPCANVVVEDARGGTEVVQDDTECVESMLYIVDDGDGIRL